MSIPESRRDRPMLSLRGPTGDNSPSTSPQRDCIDNRKQYTIQMLIQQDRVEEFIFIDRFPTTNESLNCYLYQNKQNLIQRKIRKFNETN